MASSSSAGPSTSRVALRNPNPPSDHSESSESDSEVDDEEKEKRAKVAKMKDGGFTVVVTKKKRQELKHKYEPIHKFYYEDYVKAEQTAKSLPPQPWHVGAKHRTRMVGINNRIQEHIEEMRSSKYIDHVMAKLTVAVSILGKELKDIKRIVCYGLGSFKTHWESRYQFAFLASLEEKLNKVAVELYDPEFNYNDIELMEENFGFHVIPENEEGNRRVDELTLFYLPHVPHGLSNNILRSNWTPNRLSKCIIIGNSFRNVLESGPLTHLDQIIPYVVHGSLFCKEHKLECKGMFKYFEPFYLLSLHYFPRHVCDSQPKNIWLSDDVKPVLSIENPTQ